MKNFRSILTIVLLSVACITKGQDYPDFEKLVQLGDLYSNNVGATGKKFKKSAEDLRAPSLNHIIDALLAIGKGDKKLMTEEFLKKPSQQELSYWYVIREIHYNKISKEANKKTSELIAKEVLKKDIDSRWLLQNYYINICGGIAKLFNTKNLAKYDIDLNSYGLKDDTEKAILYFNITHALITRFQVLTVMKNTDRLFEFANKLPTVNGKPYQEYTNFEFEDFEYMGHKEMESYKKSKMDNLYNGLNAHFVALAQKENKEDAANFYFKSILFIPKYFPFTEMGETLLEVYQDAVTK